jgi:hypothetical protein
LKGSNINNFTEILEKLHTTCHISLRVTAFKFYTECL